MYNKKIKVLLAKVGLDNQNKGIRLIARGLREQGGMEVIYSGMYCTLEEIVAIALKEDVDIVGLSIHNGSHNEIFPSLYKMLNEKKTNGTLVFGEGMIPEKHRQELRASGVVDEIFEPGASVSTIITWINKMMVR
ncbi:cobalamin B12-binding domain-containing protein [Desulfotomaculum defluvii]